MKTLVSIFLTVPSEMKRNEEEKNLKLEVQFSMANRDSRIVKNTERFESVLCMKPYLVTVKGFLCPTVVVVQQWCDPRFTTTSSGRAHLTPPPPPQLLYLNGHHCPLPARSPGSCRCAWAHVDRGADASDRVLRHAPEDGGAFRVRPFRGCCGQRRRADV